DDVDQRVDDLAPPRVGQGREVVPDASGAQHGHDESPGRPRFVRWLQCDRLDDEPLVTVMTDYPGWRNRPGKTGRRAVEKVVSGGQRGAEWGALDTSRAAGLRHETNPTRGDTFVPTRAGSPRDALPAVPRRRAGLRRAAGGVPRRAPGVRP